MKLSLIVLVTAMLWPLVTMADDISHSEARALREAGKIMSLSDIIDVAHGYKSGEVIDSELERDDDMYIYEIEILDESGRVWELEFDASNGEIIELELND